MSVGSVLLFAYGNLSRGDDAVAPLLLESIQNNAQVDLKKTAILSDYQLQIEHALDLEQRKLVLFADASVSCKGAFELTEVRADRNSSHLTHAMSPAALLQVFQAIYKKAPPPCFLLSIKAEQFELGQPLSQDAEKNLRLSCQFAERLLNKPVLQYWRKFTDNARNIAA